LAFAITLMGMGAAALFPKIGAEAGFPTIIKEVFSPIVGSIVIAALISAVMSSADTTLLSASTIFIVDIVGWFRPQQKNILPHSRWLIVLLGAGSLVIALSLQGVISAMLFAYTIYTCGVILPVIAGFFKDSLKVTPAGGLAALIGGGVAGLLSKVLAIKYLDLGALALSVVLLFTVSLLENALRNRRRVPLLDKQEG
ncbi:MAG: hypothetical protein PHR56_08760, partial [Dehalococcoidales bacterium]|nr:hypothetical protein [Dehalococcoidales bacterium]